jgi:glucokinase
MRILAGDIGGTKSNLALVARVEHGRIGPPEHCETYLGADFPTFEEMLQEYRRKHKDRVDAASFGVAGPPIAGHVRGVHLPWEIDSRSTSRSLDGAPVHLLNDLVATAYSIRALSETDLVPIQEGSPDLEANRALVSAGTGLGESILAKVGADWIPIASEGGHADFAPRSDPEVDLFRALRARFGRVSVERILSGPGLVHTARWTHGREDGRARWAAHESESPEHGLPALVSRLGLDRECPWCAEAFDLFVSNYGAEAGNLALRCVARAGVYLGGGIAPKVLPALQSDLFRRAFQDKEPHRDLLARIPVWAIRNELAPVLGAARYATLSPS